MLFSRQSEVEKWKFERNRKIWKSKMAAACDITYLTLLPWKPIRHHVVSLNWKYKWSLLYVPNFKSIGWIVSKVEGGGGSDWPPSRLRVTIFSRRLLGLIWYNVYRCSPKGFSATCCSLGWAESMYRAPLAAAIWPMRDLGACRDEFTGQNTCISLFLSTSAWVLLSTT